MYDPPISSYGYECDAQNALVTSYQVEIKAINEQISVLETQRQLVQEKRYELSGANCVPNIFYKERLDEFDAKMNAIDI